MLGLQVFTLKPGSLSLFFHSSLSLSPSLPPLCSGVVYAHTRIQVQEEAVELPSVLFYHSPFYFPRDWSLTELKAGLVDPPLSIYPTPVLLRLQGLCNHTQRLTWMMDTWFDLRSSCLGSKCSYVHKLPSHPYITLKN